MKEELRERSTAKPDGSPTNGEAGRSQSKHQTTSLELLMSSGLDTILDFTNQLIIDLHNAASFYADHIEDLRSAARWAEDAIDEGGLVVSRKNAARSAEISRLAEIIGTLSDIDEMPR